MGGFIAAFLLPVLIYVNNIAYPLHLWPFSGQGSDPTSLMITSMLGVLFIFVTVAGSLFHGVFRFQATLPELGLKRFKEKLAAIGYALAGTGILALAYYVLFLNPGFRRLFGLP